MQNVHIMSGVLLFGNARRMSCMTHATMERVMAKAAKKPLKSAQPSAGDDGLGTALVAMPKTNAAALRAGMEALNYIEAFASSEQQLGELRESVSANRGMAQVTLAYHIWNVSKGDTSIRLADSMLDDKKHKSEKNKLGKQIRLALGLMVSDGTKTVPTDEYRAKTTAMPGDDERTIKRKKSIRANFATMLTKAMRVALHAIENNLTMTVEKTGHLRLTDGRKGHAIKQQFGESSVVLNEDQNVKLLDKKGQVIGTKALKARPSFTEITRAVGDAHGKAVVARKDSRTQTVDPQKYLIDLCGALVKAIEKLPDEVPAPITKALESVQSAIEEAIA